MTKCAPHKAVKLISSGKMTFDYRVALLDPRPSTLNSQSSTLDSRPSTLNPQTSILNSKTVRTHHLDRLETLNTKP